MCRHKITVWFEQQLNGLTESTSKHLGCQHCSVVSAFHANFFNYRFNRRAYDIMSSYDSCLFGLGRTGAGTS